MAKMIITFHNFANAPTIEEILSDVSKKASLKKKKTDENQLNQAISSVVGNATSVCVCVCVCVSIYIYIYTFTWVR